MKKVLSAFLAVATIAGSLATAMPAAQARDGGAVAAGVGLGILGGAIAGAATAITTIRAATTPQKAENGARRKNVPKARQTERRRAGRAATGSVTVAVIDSGSSGPGGRS